MTSLYDTSEKANPKRVDYGIVLALVCVALALVVASVVFTPVPVGSGITSEITSVGP
jgi:biopolymer transport protein ExbB/TolQ